MYIPIFPSHKNILSFAVGNKVYQWACLLFGPTSAPRIFTKIVTVVAAYNKTFVWQFISKIGLLQDLRRMINRLVHLGFKINAKKSLLQPTQYITYIGNVFYLNQGVVSPTSYRQIIIFPGI